MMRGKRGPLLPLAISLVIIAALIVWLRWGADVEPAQGELLLYCAAVMQRPMTEIVAQYEQETGVRVRVQYGGSGTLLSNLKVAQRGDLYLAADASYTRIASAEGLIEMSSSVSELKPVMAVAKGNPKGVATLDDLARDDLRVGLANPDTASIGKQTKVMLVRRGDWARVERQIRARGVFKPTVSDVANDVKLGAVDVGIIWDATARQYPELEALAIPEAEADRYEALIAVLKMSAHRSEAAAFAHYVSASPDARRILERAGFEPTDGVVGVWP